MEDDTDDSSSRESINAFSKKFDSFKALYSDKVLVPVPEAPIFDNVGKFETVVLKGNVIKSTDSEEKITKASQPPGRNFLPEQLPVPAKQYGRNQNKNVMSNMQKYYGPLAVLFQYMENRTRVRICIRNAKGIRGYIEAYIAAFDRHWNLALEDCFERWDRKLNLKAPALGESNKAKMLNVDNSSPKIIVKKSGKKFQTLERHVPQLLVRGEQVVLVTKIDID